jgi:type III secretion protein W
MDQNIKLNPHLQNESIGLGQTAAAASEAMGSLSGYAVTVAADPLSLLADAAEELTFAMDNTSELDLKERREKEEVSQYFLEKVQLYQELIHEAGKDGDIVSLAQSLKQLAQANAALSKAREFFPDPAEAYAALQEILSGLEESNPQRPLVQETLNLLEAESGAQIRSSLVSAWEARGYPDLGSPLDLKNDYHTVIDFPEATEMLAFIQEKYGEEGFDQGLEFLVKALSVDLAAAEPGSDQKRLEAATGQLGQVKVLSGIHSQGERLTSRWQGVHEHKESELKPMDYLKFMVSLRKESYIPSSVVRPLIQLARPTDQTDEVIFLQELLTATKNLSLMAFESPTNRDRCLTAVQEALDLAIEAEDDYLASLEQ